MNLSIIILIQSVAFCYGAYTSAQGRPAWIVFNVDRFDLVQSYELAPFHLKKAVDEYKASGWLGPKWVAAVQPSDAEARSDLVFDSLLSGVDLPQRPDLYVPYEQEIKNIQRKAIPIDDLKKYNNAAEVDAIMQPMLMQIRTSRLCPEKWS